MTRYEIVNNWLIFTNKGTSEEPVYVPIDKIVGMSLDPKEHYTKKPVLEIKVIGETDATVTMRAESVGFLRFAAMDIVRGGNVSARNDRETHDVTEEER